MLCKKCQNPETTILCKDGGILLDCKACGERSDVDVRLKLSSFILKNQPKKGKKSKGDKKARRGAKAGGKDGADAGAGGSNGSGSDNVDDADGDAGDLGLEAGSDDELTRRITAEAKEVEQPSEIKDDEWAVDVSEEAVKARAKELPDDLKQKLVFDEDDDGEGEGGGSSAYDQFGSWIIAAAGEKAAGVGELDDVEIYVKAKDMGIEGKYKTVAVLAQTMFDKDIVAQIPKRAGMLKKVGHRILSASASANASR